MFDIKSSFILSKLGIQGFQLRKENPNSNIIFGVLWGDILTLLDKSFNQLEENELKLLIKIIKSILGEESEYTFEKEIHSIDEVPKRLRLLISFNKNKTHLKIKSLHFIQSVPLQILEKNLNDKKELWLKIKEYKNADETS